MRMVEAGVTEKVHGGGVGWGYDWEGEEGFDINKSFWSKYTFSFKWNNTVLTSLGF
jgi:hypothetical protein